jgi:stage V sporulation protein AC
MWDYMKIEKNIEYKNLVKKHTPKSPLLKNCIFAFLSGGFLCFCAQWLTFLYIYLGLGEQRAYLLVTVTYIVIASLITAIGFFDKIARYSGAGTLVPVTGFSNAVTSSAIDTRSEGFISGVGSKIFTVAGPVILYSTIAGTLYGFFYYFVNMFMGNL